MSHQLTDEGIRVNSILPGAIRTTLYSDDIWTQFPKDDFTPVEEVVNTVMSLVSDETATGRAMEISAGETFDRRQPEYCNETMRRIMEGKSY
jgi:15-hydroxyprostaglandin dehydrogenase (NAD)